MKSWLLFYNLASCLAWGAVLAITIADLADGYTSKAYLGFPHKLLVLLQATNAVVETLHAVTGLVPSPLPSLLLQFYARLSITLGVTYFVPESPGNFSYAYAALSVAWATTEIIRYAFYGCKLVGRVLPQLLWLRYSAFIVLYPLGLLSEPWVVYKTIPATTGWYRTYLGYALLLYVPGFLLLYSYMWKQRNRYLVKRKY